MAGAMNFCALRGQNMLTDCHKNLQKLPQNRKIHISLKIKAFTSSFLAKAYVNGRYGTRTCDLLRVEQALYPTELTAQIPSKQRVM